MVSPSIPRGIHTATLAALLSGLIACDGRGSWLRASWGGPKAGRLQAPARVSWCAGVRRLEIEAIRDDNGVALVIFPVKALQPGRYESFDPGLYPAQRPGSAAAARWFNEQEVKGYQSDSGWAVLARKGDKYTVRFGYRMIAANRVDTLRLTGQVSAFLPDTCPVDSGPDSTASE